MKHFVVLALEDLIVPIDLVSDTASQEIKSLLEQGFKIVKDELHAKSTEDALLQTRKLLNHKQYMEAAGQILPISEEAKIVKVSTNSEINLKQGLHIDLVCSEKIAIINSLTVGGGTKKLNELRIEVLDELKKQAHRLGANAVTGLQINITTNTGSLGVMSSLGGDPKGDILACVSGVGSAVLIEFDSN